MHKNKQNIRLKVKDLGAAVAFYSSIGFKFPKVLDLDSPIHIVDDASDIELALIPERLFPSASNKQSSEEYELIQINYTSTEAVDKAYENAAYKGYNMLSKPKTSFWGTRSAKVSDPDGHNLLLYTTKI